MMNTRVKKRLLLGTIASGAVVIIYVVILGGRAAWLHEEIKEARGISFLCLDPQSREQLELTDAKCREANEDFQKAGNSACHLNGFLPFKVLSAGECYDTFGLDQRGWRIYRVQTLEERNAALRERHQREKTLLEESKTLRRLSEPSTAYARSADASREMSFLEFFNGVCLLNMPRIDKIKAGAREMKWSHLTGDAAVMIAPADPNAAFEGWSVQQDKEIYFVGVSDGSVDSRRVVTCATAGRGFNQDSLVKTIESNVTSERINDEVETMQRFRAWRITVSGQTFLLNLTTTAKNAVTPVAVLSVIAQLK